MELYQSDAALILLDGQDSFPSVGIFLYSIEFYPHAEVRDVFRRFPNVIEVDFIVNKDDDDETQLAQPLKLPFLRGLYLSTRSDTVLLLDLLHLPALKTFIFNGMDQPNIRGHWNHAIAKLIDRSRCSLRSLQLRYPYAENDSLLECLRLSPCLQTLTLQESISVDVTKKVIEALTAKTEHSPVLLQELQRMTVLLSSWHGRTKIVTALVTMVESRRHQYPMNDLTLTCRGDDPPPMSVLLEPPFSALFALREYGSVDIRYGFHEELFDDETAITAAKLEAKLKL